MVFKEKENSNSKCVRLDGENKKEKFFEPGCRLVALYTIDPKAHKVASPIRGQLIENNDIVTNIIFLDDGLIGISGFGGIIEFIDQNAMLKGSTLKFPIIYNFAISPNKINYAIVDGSRLYIMKRDEYQPIFHDFTDSSIFGQLSYNDDGSIILITNKHDISLINAVSGDRITSITGQDKFLYAVLV